MSRTRSLRILIVSALAVSLSAPASPEVPAVQSRKASQPVTLDGRADEWASNGLILDTRSGAESAFQNDGRNLYILLAVKGSEPSKSAESTGVMVLTRPEGTQKSQKGVLFLTRDVSAEDYIRWHESQGAVMTDGEKGEIRKTARHPLFLAFAVDARGSTYGPLRHRAESDPPEFAVARRGTETTYEFMIPLASPGLVPGGIGVQPGQTVRISFEWGGVNRKILGTKGTRETPPSEKGELSGSGGTWGQEFLDTFDPMSRPYMSTKKYSIAVDVKLAETS